MTTTTSDSQPDVFLAMRLMGVRPETIQPKPPNNICDAFMPLGPGQWCIIVNDRGQFTIHIIEDATEKEAWAYFDGLKPAGVTGINPRVLTINSDGPERN